MTRPSSHPLRDVGVVLGVLAVVGIVAGVLWALLVDPVVAVRTEAGVARTEIELTKQVGADGWFATIGFVVSLVAGVGFMLRRGRDEIVTLLTVVAGAMIAAWLCSWVGGIVGPGPASDALADAAVGATAEDTITVSAFAAYLAWPFGAVVGCLVVLLGVGSSRRHDEQPVVQ